MTEKLTSDTTGDYVEQLCSQLLKQHGLEGWTIRWDRAKRRAGYCNHTERTISFSKVLTELYPREVMRDVVLHEVAHAIAGPRAGHGASWKRVARELGATPKAMLPNWLPEPPARWVGCCPRCGARRKLHSAPRRVVSCGRCSSDFDHNLVFQWEHLGSPVVPGGSYSKELRRIGLRQAVRTPH